MEPVYNYADGKLDEFFEIFMNGCLSYGSYKLLDSLKYYGKPNFLFIKYDFSLSLFIVFQDMKKWSTISKSKS